MRRGPVSFKIDSRGSTEVSAKMTGDEEGIWFEKGAYGDKIGNEECSRWRSLT